MMLAGVGTRQKGAYPRRGAVQRDRVDLRFVLRPHQVGLLLAGDAGEKREEVGLGRARNEHLRIGRRALQLQLVGIRANDVNGLRRRLQRAGERDPDPAPGVGDDDTHGEDLIDEARGLGKVTAAAARDGPSLALLAGIGNTTR
ncbi:MAG: hypothetical protein FJ318_06620 [SAR202 cluster bacterium]|nr:hypothetical protein [SAR202 cluster bacterium]